MKEGASTDCPLYETPPASDKSAAEAELLAPYSAPARANLVDFNSDAVVTAVGKAVNDLLGSPGSNPPWNTLPLLNKVVAQLTERDDGTGAGCVNVTGADIDAAGDALAGEESLRSLTVATPVADVTATLHWISGPVRP